MGWSAIDGWMDGACIPNVAAKCLEFVLVFDIVPRSYLSSGAVCFEIRGA